MIHAIDISPYQGAIDWEALGHSRYEALWGKTSQGRWVHARRRAWAADVAVRCDLRVGWYHYAELWHARDEAAAFLGSCPERMDLAPVLDLEPEGTANTWGPDGITRTALGRWASDWCRAVRRACGVQPIVYMPAGRSYVSVVAEMVPESPLWLASRPYGSRMPPDEPEGAPDCAVWQYSSRAAGVPGIVGACDRDVILRPEGVIL